jgi:hypothetical protein
MLTQRSSSKSVVEGPAYCAFTKAFLILSSSVPCSPSSYAPKSFSCIPRARDGPSATKPWRARPPRRLQAAAASGGNDTHPPTTQVVCALLALHVFPRVNFREIHVRSGQLNCHTMTSNACAASSLESKMPSQQR